MIKPAKRLESIELSQVRKMFEITDENAINLGIGEPDFNIPENTKIAIENSLNEGFTHYTPNKGIIELREAISKKLHKDNNLNVSTDEIIVTVGASEALYICAQGYFEKGDEILIPDPGFLSYKAFVELSESKAVPVEIKIENEYKMKVEEVQDKINSKTKALILNSPSNPTGAVMDKSDVKAISDLATDHDFLIISDEIYEKIIYDAKHYSPAEFTDNAIVINGFSKAYAMTGLRIGYLAGPEDMVEELLKVHQYNNACACSLSQAAAYEALTGPQNELNTMVNEFKRRRDLVLKRSREIGLNTPNVEGSFYIFPKVNNPQEYVQKALKAGVITVPGSGFGIYGKDNIRLSYATSYENIEEAMNRLETIKM
ncbi:pyridoxal phosphate-dependent aminotransferase [Methanobrevibacter filiformis]|uniref:Aminotransferase n=1 Tax=Methanobrevibacter filiformis TaxID=55758 RepID=A0A165ZD57_9EURY|nr:pyridoxal phosphate-dependent aminotransferase [Methanobrevibacter filiformis]KZX10559.1 putative N-acetyl-LL-diaminopimelate aminotransferase [Methanobrevibacter filiformis]